MAKNMQKEQMTRLGLYAVAPFVVAAAALWLSPFVIPQFIALDFHQIALVYGAVIVAYLSGAGAGVSLSPAQKMRESFLPGQLIALLDHPGGGTPHGAFNHNKLFNTCLSFKKT